jgi:hypothetical protein
MFAVIAAVLFAIAFVLNAGQISTDVVFSPFSLAMVGLALLAFHLTGEGPPVSSLRRRRR